MTTPNWQSDNPEIQQNQRVAYDKMRYTCPVAYDEKLGFSVFRHSDVMHILQHPDIFSNHVSDRHIAVPNGMDAPVHTAFRAVNDKYFTAERMTKFEPIAKAIIDDLVKNLPKNQPIDVMQHFAKDYAVKLQNAFMGWSDELETPLNAWIVKNRTATLSQDREQIAKVAVEFDEYIKAILHQKRQNSDHHADITTELLYDVVNLPNESRVMNDDELVSLIRNWTVGELSTISASVGVLIEFFATHADEFTRLKSNIDEIPLAIEEIMRLNDPLVSNRRKTTCPVQLGGVDLPTDSKITINWLSANRDEAVFPQADSYLPHRDQSQNLVYGAGLHICPGAPLARLKLRLLAQSLLENFAKIEVASEDFVSFAKFPVAGFERLDILFK